MTPSWPGLHYSMVLSKECRYSIVRGKAKGAPFLTATFLSRNWMLPHFLYYDKRAGKFKNSGTSGRPVEAWPVQARPVQNGATDQIPGDRRWPSIRPPLWQGLVLRNCSRDPVFTVGEAIRSTCGNSHEKKDRFHPFLHLTIS